MSPRYKVVMFYCPIILFKQVSFKHSTEYDARMNGSVTVLALYYFFYAQKTVELPFVVTRSVLTDEIKFSTSKKIENQSILSDD